MSGQDPDELTLAQLLCSRVCHDLVGPVGAVNTAVELMAFLRPKLSKLELPVAIEFREELPKTMIGKLSKKELRAQAGH